VDIIRIPENIPQVSALVDSGATSSFIDQTFVVQHNIPVIKESTPIPVEVIDGRIIASGAITHETTPLELCIGKHTEKIVLNIISTPHHPIINGLPWLEAHNPIIDWRSRTTVLSMAYRNQNSKPCMITLLKILPRGSFNIPSLQPAPQFCLSRRRMAPFDSVWIIVDSTR
jgi:hypothetical protein